jgi:hypothetical protein
MSDTVRFTIGAFVIMLPVFVATYFRGVASAAFARARALTPEPAFKDTLGAGLVMRLMRLMFVGRGDGGPEFFWTPKWMREASKPELLAHAAEFKRNRTLFWVFMASMLPWFKLVSGFFWR